MGWMHTTILVNMKNLIIIGARGYGREVYNWATQCREYNTEWRIKGFLDSDPNVLDKFEYSVPILSSVEEYEVQSNDVFICALGSIEHKKKYALHILDKGGSFISIIHPTANINNNTQIGVGCIICPFVTISNECVINEFVTIQSYTAIGHDCIIGKWCHINAQSFMGGYAQLENGVTLHTKATILPSLCIGKGATVGAGSIVIKNVKPGITVFGNPAKELRF